MANLWNSAGVTAAGPVLPLNTWTHIGYTYSTTNGIRLFINGVLYSTTGAFNYVAANTHLQIVLAGSMGGSGCSPGYGGSFTGALDEFYLYSRELTTLCLHGSNAANMDRHIVAQTAAPSMSC